MIPPMDLDPYLVDAHLDLAWLAALGRDLTAAAADLPIDAMGAATISLPDLRQARCAMVGATLFAQPTSTLGPGYTDAQGAHDQAIAQLGVYREWREKGMVSVIRTKADVPLEAPSDPGSPLRLLLLMEGADPIRSPDDVARFVEAGVRAVRLAWKRTRYSGGTSAPGPLTQEGVELLPHLDAAGLIHDLSHLSEEGFWGLLERAAGPVMASHSNCRVLVPTDRQLSDDMIRAIARRAGMIGINLYDRFLLPPDQHKTRRATLADVVDHIDHICQLLGTARHVGLGTDMDGGLGREDLPSEIAGPGDLRKLGYALRARGYGRDDVAGILGRNWQRFFAASLPG